MSPSGSGWSGSGWNIPGGSSPPAPESLGIQPFSASGTINTSTYFKSVKATDLTLTLPPAVFGLQFIVGSLYAFTLKAAGSDTINGGAAGGSAAGGPGFDMVECTATGAWSAANAGAAVGVVPVLLTGTPVAGNVPIATSASAAEWGAPSSSVTVELGPQTLGNINLTTTKTELAVLAGLDSGAWDLVIPDAAAGQVIKVSPNWATELNGVSEQAQFDCATIVGGDPVNWFSNGTSPGATAGVGGWLTFNSAILIVGTGVVATYTLTDDDISGGTVTLRLFGWAISGGSSVYADSALPLNMSASR